MKQLKKLKVFGLMAMLISMVIMASSCSDDDTGGRALSYGKVTGVVTDDLSSPLEGVTVLVDGSGITAAPDGPQTTTNSQGVYTLENISIGTHIITFTKADYQTVSVTVVAGKFNEEQVAEVSPKMEYAAAKIKGKVVDAGKGNTPLEGVTVSISSTQTATTGSDGTFEIGNPNTDTDFISLDVLSSSEDSMLRFDNNRFTLVKNIEVDLEISDIQGEAIVDSEFINYIKVNEEEYINSYITQLFNKYKEKGIDIFNVYRMKEIYYGKESIDDPLSICDFEVNTKVNINGT